MFHKYPYTDFHELNLDGLIAEWKVFLNEYKSVNDRVDDMEQAIEDFREYINNYFDNLDVQEEINNKLDEMEEDGSLEAILSHYVYMTHNPDLVQILNVAMNTHTYDVPSNPQPAFLQGYTCYNNVSYMAFMDSSGTTNDAIIRSYSNSTGQLLNESRIQNAYHANSMTVHDGHLLLCTNERHIISMNPSSLSVEINYQVTKDIKSISSYNGVLYATDSNYDLWAMTLPPDETYEHKCNFQAANPRYQFWQSNAVYGDYLYAISTNPKCIAAININTGIIRNIININDYYYMYNTGEIEDIAVVSGDEVYLASCTYGTYDQYRTGRVFNFSLNQNDARSQRYAGGDYNPIATIYVNDNTNGNPDGSIDNPFPTLSQALQALSSEIARSYQIMQINLLKDCDEIIYLRNSNVRISGGNHSVIRALVQNSMIGLYNLTFTGNINGNFMSLYATNSNIFMNNVTFDKYDGSSEQMALLSYCNGVVLNLTMDPADIGPAGFVIYESNIRSNDGTSKITYCDRESAETIDYGAVTALTLPVDFTRYKALGVRIRRGYDSFYGEVPLYQITSTNLRFTAEATSGLMVFITCNVTRSDNAISITLSGNQLNTDLTKTALEDPGHVDNVSLLSY